MKIQLTLIAAVSLLVIVASGYAHHPFSAEYDWTKPVTIMGTVSKVEWTNPHAFMYVDAKDEQGNMKQWKLEMGGLAALTRGGWTRNTLKMGDQVSRLQAELARVPHLRRGRLRLGGPCDDRRCTARRPGPS